MTRREIENMQCAFLSLRQALQEANKLTNEHLKAVLVHKITESMDAINVELPEDRKMSFEQA